jgi:hypothetical protein
LRGLGTKPTPPSDHIPLGRRCALAGCFELARGLTSPPSNNANFEAPQIVGQPELRALEAEVEFLVRPDIVEELFFAAHHAVKFVTHCTLIGRLSRRPPRINSSTLPFFNACPRRHRETQQDVHRYERPSENRRHRSILQCSSHRKTSPCAHCKSETVLPEIEAPLSKSGHCP